jgi:dephospho-CoA kinase
MNDRTTQNVVAVVGMTGSGKSVVSDALTEQGYQFLRFGQITLDIVKERGLAPTEENERPIREGIREKHGMGGYAILNIPKIDQLLEKGPVVADGLYSWSEYKILKEKYGQNLIVIAVYAPPALRYERLAGRTLAKDDTDLRHRPATITQSSNRDKAEIEQVEKGGPIAMADFTLINTGTVEELMQQLNEVLKYIDGR